MYTSILENKNKKMKSIKHINSKAILILGLAVLTLIGCERDLSDDAEFATFAKTGPIFTDTFIGLGTNFFFPFVSDGAKADVFSVDETEGYESNASIRIDVPNANDPDGNFAGAIFLIDGSGRDLTEFDALTFWAKASQAATIGTIGFGEGRYQVLRSNVDFTTVWTKFIIPIPDPSKLIEEKGMFLFSAGGIGQEGQEVGYTFWLDEIQFEKLGTIGQARPAILNGADVVQDAFVNIPVQLTGLTQTFNLASGQNLTVSAQPAYFDFTSTDIEVARVSELGVVSIVDTGTATITATLADVAAAGSLDLNVTGGFDFAPAPPERIATDVVSVFSDAYNNVPVDYYNGFFNGDGQTTQGGAPPIDVNGDAVINYTALNFVGIGTFLDVAPINISEMTHMHVDIKVNEAIDSGDSLTLTLLNSVGNGETSGSVNINGSALTTDEWVSLDIPLADFSGLGDRSQIGLLFFISGGISDIFVDNIYYYR